ncbi:hypothetical protein AABD41_13225 [Staphylococcus pseudoxylosus]|uniref:immunodominant staphylococcal antigen IsaB family protein n=1 Tax=Staphylococcus pseudoxylosus TaxID=2282419 RepID=UPI00398B3D52
MKKFTKVILAGGIALSTLLGTTATQFASQSNVAEAVVKPWYNYTGMTGHNGNFILDSNFKNAVKHNNVKINGYHIYADTQSALSYQKYSKEVKVHEQKMMKFATNKAIQTKFPVKKNHISQKQLTKVWGEGKVVNTGKGQSIYYTLNGNNIKFDIQNGYVTEVTLGTVISN